ncbi:MAG: DNA photolyase family protein [Kiritimatiellae bacterium]|nr:DNA photolyase family protein [Kiritimatiellia bacterium]MDW8458499.1 deoxyribodipyrimidine photo-lyase [Verrucomicrobiota bacterium]
MATAATIVWFRRDLRLHDHEALSAALKRGGSIVPVFIWAPDEESPWPPGSASKWWLHESLTAFDASLRELGSRLVIRRGPSLEALDKLIRETGASAIYWSRLYEPAVIERDKQIKSHLRARGIDARSFNASLLHEPWTIQTSSGKPYQVFTPFYRACQEIGDPSTPLPAPRELPSCPPVDSLTIADLGLLPRIPWYHGMAQSWQPGETGALRRLESFSPKAPAYKVDRDRPDLESTSRLSPHLHFGEISPRMMWWAIRKAHPGGSAESYLRQLIWREFAHHLLFHFPYTATEPLRPEFRSFPWRENPAALKAWQKGRTGYPIVDAGMRELWHTGWMHNRVRMIVASFLVKDLLVPWQRGAEWFWDTLVDADLANNTLGWQWTAGCGADAAPYFRIFNPILQGEKFDPDGEYVRRWVPELASLPSPMIHRVPELPDATLRQFGIELGRDYPRPLVDHASARDVALAAFDAIRRAQ